MKTPSIPVVRPTTQVLFHRSEGKTAARLAWMVRSLAVRIVLFTARPATAQCTGPAVITFTGQSVIGSSTITNVTPSTAGLSVGMPLTGPGIPAGTTITSIVNSTAFTMSSNATSSGTVTIVIQLTTLVPDDDWEPATVPNEPPYPFNFPPSTAGFCEVCPSQFTVDICGNEYAQMYMCAGNLYTIGMCGSTAPWNSTISITGGTLEFEATDGSVTFDDDGCGTADGHAQLTYAPAASGLRFIRILTNVGGDPCIPNFLLCGTLSISCSPTPTSVSETGLRALDPLWPNPAHDLLTLKAGDANAYSWELLDQRGTVVQRGRTSGDLHLPVAELSSGLYLLRTTAANGLVQEHKWVKE